MESNSEQPRKVDANKIYPAPASTIDPQNPYPHYGEWNPNRPLARRIPALRNYGIVLTAGSVVFAYYARDFWPLSHHDPARSLGYIIYAALGLMFVAGVVILTSKNRSSVLLCLNLVLLVALGVGIFSIARMDIIMALASAIAVWCLLNAKYYVKQANAS